MRARFLALLLVLIAGCADSLGVVGDCSSEMREVRRVNGQPGSSQKDQFGGDFTEQWIYFVGGTPDRVYTFRWGASYESCEVQGPTRFSQALLTKPLFP